MSDAEKSTSMSDKGQPIASVIHEGLPTQLPDIDPDETQEWLASFDAMLDDRGRDRARYVMLRLLERAREKQVGVPALRSTDSSTPSRRSASPGSPATRRSSAGSAPSSAGTPR